MMHDFWLSTADLRLSTADLRLRASVVHFGTLFKSMAEQWGLLEKLKY